MADEQSREVFLRVIKCIETGDCGYLPLARYAQYQHPATLPEKGDMVIEGGVGYGYPTDYFSQMVGDDGYIASFEPVLRVWEENCVRFQHHKNVRMVNLGLWSGANTFNIEDVGGASSMSSLATPTSQECHSIDIDTWSDTNVERCSLIKLDIEGAEMECLKGAYRTIQTNRPKLHLSLYHTFEHYLDIPLWVMDNFPEYKLYIGHHGAWCYETCLYAAPTEEKITPVVSFIIYTQGTPEILSTTLDSLLMQSANHIEAIILQRHEATDDVVKRYSQQYPHIFKVLRFDDSHIDGNTINVALERASGRYWSILAEGDILADDFIVNATLLLEQANIAILSKVYATPLGFVSPSIEDCVLQGDAAFNYLLNFKNIGEDAFIALYRYPREETAFLGESKIWPELFLQTILLENGGTIAFSSSVGVYSLTPPNKNGKVSADSALHEFAVLARQVRGFCAARGEEIGEGPRRAITEIYTACRSAILAELRAAYAKGADGFAVEDLRDIASSKLALELLLSDYASINRGIKGQNICVTPGREDWRSFQAPLISDTGCTPYGDADLPGGEPPLLSVIMANYNKEQYVGAALDSILTQSMDNFELIIVDDASTDNSFEALRVYADRHPTIRLYRMDSNSGQSVCQNMALERARGQYITFVDSDDRITNDFFINGLDLIAKKGADIAIFSHRVTRADGSTKYEKLVPDATPNSTTALHMYLASGFSCTTWGKIYRRDFLEWHNARFLVGLFHEDQHFVGGLLLQRPRVVTSSFVAYIVSESDSSITRSNTKDYRHIHSACRLYEYFAHIVGEDIDKCAILASNHMRYNLEDNHLLALDAYLRTYGELAIQPDDWKCLQHNLVFTLSILMGLGRLSGQNSGTNFVIDTPAPVPLLLEHTVKPVLSVIIPAYNSQRWIGRCLDSILAQDMINFEIILVDDASTDSTLDICKRYAKKDARIRIFSNKDNRGQGYSRNFAIEHCHGRFLTFVDCDDYILPHFFLHGCATLEACPDADLIQFAKKEEENGRITRRGLHLELVAGDEVLASYLSGKSRFFEVWGKIYRTGFIRRHEITFPDHLYEDNVFLVRVFQKARKILFSPDVAYVYTTTVNEHSAVHPKVATYRHVQGIFALSSALENMLDPAYSVLVKKRIRNFYSSFKAMLYDYLNPFLGLGYCPLTAEDFANVRSSPILFGEILHDFQRIYSYGGTPPLPVATSRQHSISPSEIHLIPIEESENQRDTIQLSVIIPAWHAATTITAAIDSIRDQRDVEIILVEDCSTDDETLGICKQLAKKYPSIRLFRTSAHVGQAQARNLAMDKARGEFLTFLDADDTFHDAFPGGVKELLGTTQCDIISFSVEKDGLEGLRRLPKPTLYTTGIEACAHYLAGSYGHYEVWGRCFRTKFLRHNNLLFPQLAFHEATPFMVNALLSCKSHLYYQQYAVCHMGARQGAIMNNIHIGEEAFQTRLALLRIVGNLLYSTPSIARYSELVSPYRKWLINSQLWIERDIIGYMKIARDYCDNIQMCDIVFDTLCTTDEMIGLQIMRLVELAGG